MGIRVGLRESTYGFIDPHKNGVRLPHTFDTSSIVSNDNEFREWKSRFVRLFGDDGTLCESYGLHYNLEGNDNWDAYCRSGGEAIREFYSGSNWTGD